jgi:hypothetical protein
VQPPCAALIVVTLNVRFDWLDILLLVLPVVLRDVFPAVAPPAVLPAPLDVPAPAVVPPPVEVPAPAVAPPVEVPAVPVDVPAVPVDVPAPVLPDAPDVLRPVALLPAPDSGASEPTISTH